jgi:hypothetical protein
MHFHERITPALALPIGNSHTKSVKSDHRLPQPANMTLIFQNTVPFNMKKSGLNA